MKRGLKDAKNWITPDCHCDTSDSMKRGLKVNDQSLYTAEGYSTTPNEKRIESRYCGRTRLVDRVEDSMKRGLKVFPKPLIVRRYIKLNEKRIER